MLFFSCWFVIPSNCSLSSDSGAESHLQTSVPHQATPLQFLLTVLPLCYPSHIWLQSFSFSFFVSHPLFSFFLFNLPLLHYPPFSRSLVLSFTVSQLTKHFSLTFPLFPLPPNLSSFIAIFLSLTVGYIFSYPSLFSSAISPKSLHPYLHLSLVHSGNSALTKETAMQTNKQWGCRSRWRAKATSLGQGHFQSKTRCGIKLNSKIVKLKAHCDVFKNLKKYKLHWPKLPPQHSILC